MLELFEVRVRKPLQQGVRDRSIQVVPVFPGPILKKVRQPTIDPIEHNVTAAGVIGSSGSETDDVRMSEAAEGANLSFEELLRQLIRRPTNELHSDVAAISYIDGLTNRSLASGATGASD